MITRQQPTGDNKQFGKATGHNLPLFAQPLNGSKLPAPMSAVGERGGSLWSRPLVWSAAVVMCGALLALALPNIAQNSPGAFNTRATPPAQARSAAPAASTPAINPLPEMREENRRSVDFYTQTVRGNMFSAPQSPAPPPAKAVPPVVVKPQPPVVVPPVVINPFAEWSYTGTMKSGEETTALIENTRTKEGQFLKAGDSFLGEQITAITDQEIVLKSGKTSRTLAKTDNITVTPLDRSAIPTNPQGQAGQANVQAPVQVQMSVDLSNMQGGGRGRGGFGGDSNGQTFSLPNGRSFNPQQWQQRSQRMNRNFNGG